MSGFVLLGLLFALAALAFVMYPILRPTQDVEPSALDRSELGERRQALYRQILEIEFDQRVGKIGERDAGELTRQLLGQASALLAQESVVEREIDATVEREVLAVRQALAVARRPELDPVGS